MHVTSQPNLEKGKSDHRYLGKYRGEVVDNFDEKGEMRLIVKVPDVSSEPLGTWALCSTPVGGPQHGFFSVPPKGAGVWVEFEQGDIDCPIWSGCFWGSRSEAPDRSKEVHKKGNQSITLQTPSKHSLTISDKTSEGIVIKTPGNALIQCIDGKITIDNAKGASIVLDGSQIKIKASKVDINQGALTITQ